MLPDLQKVIDEYKPDLLIHDTSDDIIALAAEWLAPLWNTFVPALQCGREPRRLRDHAQRAFGRHPAFIDTARRGSIPQCGTLQFSGRGKYPYAAGSIRANPVLDQAKDRNPAARPSYLYSIKSTTIFETPISGFQLNGDFSPQTSDWWKDCITAGSWGGSIFVQEFPPSPIEINAAKRTEIKIKYFRCEIFMLI
jgi:hypothetical protein